MPSTSIVFADLWMHEVSDLSTNRQFRYASISPSSKSDTQVVKMSQGRLVSITTAGVMREWRVSLKYISRADALWIRAQEGTTKFFRTAHGETFFATITGITESEDLLQGLPHNSPTASIEFTLNEVTMVVEV